MKNQKTYIIIAIVVIVIGAIGYFVKTAQNKAAAMKYFTGTVKWLDGQPNTASWKALIIKNAKEKNITVEEMTRRAVAYLAKQKFGVEIPIY